MSANAASEIPIKAESLTEFRPNAKALLTTITYTAGRDLAGLRRQIAGSVSNVAFASQDEKPKPKQVEILKIAKRLSGDDTVLDEDMNFLLNTVQTGMQIGFYLAGQYDQFSGLRTLRQTASTDTEKGEMGQKVATQAAVAAYVTVLYVLWKLSTYKKEELAALPNDFPGIPESIPLTTQYGALTALLFHWGTYLDQAQSSFGAVKLTQMFFAAALDELKRRSGELKYPDAFTGQFYKLEKTNFIVNGFKDTVQGAAAVVEFRRTELKEIFGNHDAKRVALQVVQFLMAYEFNSKRNPAADIGAFAWLGVFQGWAGTGKSMLLQAIQTILTDRAKQLGIPFAIRPVPGDIISSLQGDSARKYLEYFRTIMNPDELCFAPGDDCEVLYLNRSDHSSSEGSKMVVQSHLQATEGSTAFNHGNVLKVDATNNAFMIDPAVFSRYQFKVIVPGAVTRHDFLDTVKTFGDKVNKLRPKQPIIDLSFPTDYQYLADQGMVAPAEKMEQRAHGLVEFKNKGLVEVYDSVKQKKLTVNQYDLYGTLFAAMKVRYPEFTSRDVRNITTNVMARLFGFPFPEKWFDDKDLFFSKNYDDRKDLLVKYALEYQGGLSVAEVMFQEMVSYVESAIEMLASGRKKRIETMADSLAEQEEAAELYRSRRQALITA